jgi:hypothetical protein
LEHSWGHYSLWRRRQPTKERSPHVRDSSPFGEW